MKHGSRQKNQCSMSMKASLIAILKRMAETMPFVRSRWLHSHGVINIHGDIDTFLVVPLGNAPDGKPFGVCEAT